LTISVQTKGPLSLEQIRALVEASGDVRFKGRDRQQVYGWVNLILREQSYETERPGYGGNLLNTLAFSLLKVP
jgi:hypothetical protein